MTDQFGMSDQPQVCVEIDGVKAAGPKKHKTWEPNV